MENKKEVQSVKFYEHPEYMENQKFYTEIDDFLFPRHEVLKSTNYLWLHAFEDEARQVDDRDKKLARYDRELREKRTQYVNYLKMVSNRIISLIIKGGFDFGEDAKLFEKGIKDNVDGQNTNIESYFAKLFLDNLAFGKCFNLVNTKTNLSVLSADDELNNPNVRPYFVRLHPLSVKDWQLLNSGQFSKLRYEYEVLEDRTNLSDEPFITRYCEVWELLDITLDDGTQKGIVQISQFKSVDKNNKIINYYSTSKVKINKHHSWMPSGAVQIDKLSELPIVSISNDPWLEDSLPIVKKIYNKDSDLDNIIYHAGYDKVTISANLDNAVDTDGKLVDESQKKIKIAHNSITLLPLGSEMKKLEPTYPEALFKSLEKDLASLFQISFNMLRVSPVDSKMGEAADARKELKEDLLTRIKEKREQYISFVRKSISIFAKFIDANTDYESKTSFKRDIEESDLDEFIMSIKQIANRIERYPLWEKAVDMKLAQQHEFPNKEEILKEIEGTDLQAVKEAEAKQIASTFGKIVNTNNKAQK